MTGPENTADHKPAGERPAPGRPGAPAVAAPGPAGPPGDPRPAPPASPDQLQRGREQVMAALDRLARGTFARCDICGDQIDDRRLRVEPAADRCPRHLATPA